MSPTHASIRPSHDNGDAMGDQMMPPPRKMLRGEVGASNRAIRTTQSQSAIASNRDDATWKECQPASWSAWNNDGSEQHQDRGDDQDSGPADDPCPDDHFAHAHESMSSSLEETDRDPQCQNAATQHLHADHDMSIISDPSSSGYRHTPPTTKLDDIVGQAAAKLRIEELLLPLMLPQDVVAAVYRGIRRLKTSILLHGPPGCGKTRLAEAVAGEAAAALLTVGPGDILSKFVGESESQVRSVFEQARHAAAQMDSNCCVLFFDEIDALGQSRGGTAAANTSSSAHGGGGPGSMDTCSRRVLTELLLQLNMLNGRNDGDGAGNMDDAVLAQTVGNDDENSGDQSNTGAWQNACDHTNLQAKEDHHQYRRSDNNGGRESCSTSPLPIRVIVVAATNRPGDLDSALLRRFGIRVHIGLPSKKDRSKLLRRLLADIDNDLTGDEIRRLAAMTEGWSGSDLESLGREAAMAPVRECIRVAALLRRKNRNGPTHRQSKATTRNLGHPKDTTTNGGAGEAVSMTILRTKLVADLTCLRPVSSSDFEAAMSFCSDGGGSALGSANSIHNYDTVNADDGVETHDGVETRLWSMAHQEHYDSSSDEENDDDDDLDVRSDGYHDDDQDGAITHSASASLPKSV